MVAQLGALAIQSAVPFVAFGFMDNFIMIVAGDQIDAALGATLGFSAMMCAGLGNALSDVVGVGTGGAIEAAAGRLGLPDPKLSTMQAKSAVAKSTITAASAVGIALGCVLGLVPLAFRPDEEVAPHCTHTHLFRIWSRAHATP